MLVQGDWRCTRLTILCGGQTMARVRALALSCQQLLSQPAQPSDCERRSCACRPASQASAGTGPWRPRRSSSCRLSWPGFCLSRGSACNRYLPVNQSLQDLMHSRRLLWAAAKEQCFAYKTDSLRGARAGLPSCYGCALPLGLLGLHAGRAFLALDACVQRRAWHAWFDECMLAPQFSFLKAGSMSPSACG